MSAPNDMPLTGLHCVMYLSATEGASDAWDGADGYNWEVDIKTEIAEVKGWEDTWKRKAYQGADWTARVEKFVTSWDFLDAILDAIESGTVFYAEFYEGGASSVGSLVGTGQVLVAGVGLKSPVGPALENIELAGYGSFSRT